MDDERRILQESSTYLRASLQDLGWDCGRSVTQIIPVLVGKESDTVAASKWLEEYGIFATAIRPPTVEPDKSRIRLAVTALHQKEDIDQVIAAFRQYNKQL